MMYVLNDNLGTAAQWFCGLVLTKNNVFSSWLKFPLAISITKTSMYGIVLVVIWNT